jgi:hypothetical protein
LHGNEKTIDQNVGKKGSEIETLDIKAKDLLHEHEKARAAQEAPQLTSAT